MSSEPGLWDTPGLCRWAYETSGFDPSDPPLVPRLVDALLGDGAVWPVVGTWLDGRRARLIKHPQAHTPGWRPDTMNWSIQVRRRLSLTLYFWELAHELAEYILEEVAPYQGEDREQFANALAALLLQLRQLVFVGSSLAAFLGRLLRCLGGQAGELHPRGFRPDLVEPPHRGGVVVRLQRVGQHYLDGLLFNSSGPGELRSLGPVGVAVL